MAVVMTSTEGRERLSGEGESEWERRRGGSTAPVITVSAALQLKTTVKYHSSVVGAACMTFAAECHTLLAQPEKSPSSLWLASVSSSITAPAVVASVLGGQGRSLSSPD